MGVHFFVGTPALSPLAMALYRFWIASGKKAKIADGPIMLKLESSIEKTIELTIEVQLSGRRDIKKK